VTLRGDEGDVGHVVDNDDDDDNAGNDGEDGASSLSEPAKATVFMADLGLPNFEEAESVESVLIAADRGDVILAPVSL
jgi:hypothetical protein